jgi:hypothetical protein
MPVAQLTDLTITLLSSFHVSFSPHSQSKGKSRLQQIVDWLGGADFEGVLVFDEVG